MGIYYCFLELGHPLRFLCAPIELCPTGANFAGALAHSNNVGELSAILFALYWLYDYLCSCSADLSHPEILPAAVIEYDSVYAADAIRRRSRVRTNVDLVLKARHSFDEIARFTTWLKVSSHTGQFLKGRADQLANCGAIGIASGPADIAGWTGRARAC